MTVFSGGPQDNIKYTLTAPDGSVGVFNDSTDANYIGMCRFTGLDGVDIREAVDPRAGADGGIQGLNFRGPRAIVGTVDIVPTSTSDRNAKVTKLKRCINARLADGTMTFQPDGGAPQQQVKYRISQPHRRGADKVGFVTQYQFGLTCADPNIYSSALRGPTSVTAPTVLTNQGDGRAPIIASATVTSVSNVVIANQTAGQQVNLLNADPATVLGSYNLTFAPGTTGAGNGQLANPVGAEVDGAGNVLVADWLNARVQVFNSSGVYQSQFGTFGTGNGQFKQPTDIAIDGAGKIWVVDSGNNRIQRFSAAGVYETQFGATGSGNGQFVNPTGIAIDGAGNIFVTDSGNNRVQKLTAGTPPVYASQLGTLGTGNGQFGNPRGIVVDSGGTNLWVVDSSNNRVQKITNASPPVYVSQFGSLGSGNGQLNSPSFIVRDSANNLFVSDISNYRVQKFNSAGVYQNQIGGYGSGSSQFKNPQGVAMLGSTTTPLYVVDATNNNVQKIDVGAMTLTLDFAVASVIVAGQNFYRLVDIPSSTWWSLAPGDSTVSITGTGVTAGTVTWRDTWE